MASKNSCACHGVVVTLASCLLLVAAAVSVSVLTVHVAVGRVWSPAGAGAAAGHHHSLSPAWVPSPSSRHAHHARELVNRRVRTPCSCHTQAQRCLCSDDVIRNGQWMQNCSSAVSDAGSVNAKKKKKSQRCCCDMF